MAVLVNRRGKGTLDTIVNLSEEYEDHLVNLHRTHAVARSAKRAGFYELISAQVTRRGTQRVRGLRADLQARGCASGSVLDGETGNSIGCVGLQPALVKRGVSPMSGMLFGHGPPNPDELLMGQGVGRVRS